MEIMKREVFDLKDRKFPEKVCFKPIGIIHTEFKTLKGIPIQFWHSESKGTIEIFPEYIPALKDLDGFSHAYCLYLFDMVKLPVPLQSKPFLDDKEHGVFAIRTPFRPNPIGLSIFEILSIKNGNILVNNVDVLDKTPLLDIKPYLPQFDAREAKKIGWLQGKIKTKLS
jgi:tRNA-Thr(GGU) m(6)t(6)A37 methyltransferase TsaA